MNIVPSILEKRSKDLSGCLSSLSPFYHRFQMDIADGIFVPHTTVQIPDILPLVSNYPSTVFDFHLMVSGPKTHVKEVEKLPAKNVGIILIHSSVFPNYSQLQEEYPKLRFGLVLNPEDEVVELDPRLLSTIPAIQIMTVIPGMQGQPFISNALNKVEQLRKSGFGGEIYIDGAINEETLPLIASLPQKPDVLCPGSYLTRAPQEDLGKRVGRLSLL